MCGGCNLDATSLVKAHDPDLRDIHFGPFSLIEGIGGVSASPLIATKLLLHSERRKGPKADIASEMKDAANGGGPKN